MVKRCTRCREDKEHGPNRHRADGLQVYCRECVRDYNANRRATTSKEREWHRARRQRLRAEMLQAYGGKCACCGEDEPVFLALDHVDGLSDEDRVDGPRRRLSTDKIIARLKKQDWPDGYQLLCHNCNAAKAILGECPHRRERHLKVVA
jgi:hypothetical protein